MDADKMTPSAQHGERVWTRIADTATNHVEIVHIPTKQHFRVWAYCHTLDNTIAIADSLVDAGNALRSVANPAKLPVVLALLKWQIDRYPGDVSDKLKDAFKALDYQERTAEG